MAGIVLRQVTLQQARILMADKSAKSKPAAKINQRGKDHYKELFDLYKKSYGIDPAALTYRVEKEALEMLDAGTPEGAGVCVTIMIVRSDGGFHAVAGVQLEPAYFCWYIRADADLVCADEEAAVSPATGFVSTVIEIVLPSTDR